MSYDTWMRKTLASLVKHEDGSYTMIDQEGRELHSTGLNPVPGYMNFENEDGSYKTTRSIALLEAALPMGA